MLINLFIAVIAKFAIATADINLFPQTTDSFTSVGSILSGLLSGLPSANDIKMASMSTKEFIEYFGYDGLEFKTTTEDGFILTNYQIRAKNFSSSSIKVAIIITGMFDSSLSYTNHKEGLPFVLADEGFDCYVYNSRGNSYSREHVSLNPNVPGQFWNHSWHEMGYYDMPAVTDDVIKRTGGNKEITLFGHSQGAVASIVFLSTRPAYNAKIKLAVHFAPFFYPQFAGYPIGNLLDFVYAFDFFRNFEIRFPIELQRLLALSLCKPLNGLLCNSLLDQILGPSEDDRVEPWLVLSNYPSGGTKNLLGHFAQERTKGFYGPMMDVSQSFLGFPPTKYDLTKITVPNVIFYSTDDPHTTPNVLTMIQKNFPSNICINRVNQNNRFNHIDFVYGFKAPQLVYSKAIAYSAQTKGSIKCL